MKITAGELYNMGVVDRVIPEHGYFSSEIVEMIKTNLITELDELSQLPLENSLKVVINVLENIKNPTCASLKS